MPPPSRLSSRDDVRARDISPFAPRLCAATCLTPSAMLAICFFFFFLILRAILQSPSARGASDSQIRCCCDYAAQQACRAKRGASGAPACYICLLITAMPPFRCDMPRMCACRHFIYFMIFMFAHFERVFPPSPVTTPAARTRPAAAAMRAMPTTSAPAAHCRMPGARFRQAEEAA